jgi:hypothetical protein
MPAKMRLHRVRHLGEMLLLHSNAHKNKEVLPDLKQLNKLIGSDMIIYSIDVKIG